MFEIVAGELRAKLGVDSAAMCARAGHEACEAKAGPDCGEESLAGFRANAPHISDTAPPVWRAPEGPAGLAAVLVGGGGARPGFETTRRAKLAARTASRPPAHTAARPDGARNTSEATSTTSNHATQTRGSPPGPPRVHATSSYSTPSSGQPLSAVERPRPRRPGPHSGRRPCAGCHQRRPG